MLKDEPDFFSSEKSCLGRVLVVDDEPDIRKVIRATLTRAGYAVIEAEDGERAMQMTKAWENSLVLDVMISDIRMPKINGLELICYTQKEYPKISIIVLTGFPDLDMAVSFLKNGVLDYLVKPVEAERLKDAVKSAMEMRSMHSF